MSAVASLPLCSLRTGVQVDEDLLLGLAFANADGTPVDISGIVFTSTLSQGGLPVATLLGQIYGVNDRVCFIALAAAKAFLAPGVYAFSILMTDGVLSKDLLGSSTLTVGAPQAPVLVPFNSLETAVTVTVIPPGLVITQPSDVATALAALTRPQLLALANAIFKAIPNVANAEAAPASGNPLINADKFAVLEP